MAELCSVSDGAGHHPHRNGLRTPQVRVQRSSARTCRIHSLPFFKRGIRWWCVVVLVGLLVLEELPIPMHLRRGVHRSSSGGEVTRSRALLAATAAGVKKDGENSQKTAQTEETTESTWYPQEPKPGGNVIPDGGGKDVEGGRGQTTPTAEEKQPDLTVRHSAVTGSDDENSQKTTETVDTTESTWELQEPKLDGNVIPDGGGKDVEGGRGQTTPTAEEKQPDLTVRHSAVAGSDDENSQKTTETVDTTESTWDPQEPKPGGNVIPDGGGKDVEGGRGQTTPTAEEKQPDLTVRHSAVTGSDDENSQKTTETVDTTESTWEPQEPKLDGNVIPDGGGKDVEGGRGQTTPTAEEKQPDLTVRHSAVAGSHGESSQKTRETEEIKQPTWDTQEPRQEGDVVADEGGKGTERTRRQSEGEPTRKRTTRRWSASEPPPALQEISTSARSAVEPQAAKPKAKKKRSDFTVRHSAVAGSHGESSQKTTETEEAKQPTWDPQEPRQEGDVVEDEGGKGVERRRRQSEEEPTRKRTKRRRRAGEPPAALQEVSASARSAVEENAAKPKAKKKRSDLTVRHSAVAGSHGEGSQRTTEMEEAKQPTWDTQEPRQEGDVVADEGGKGIERRRRQSEGEPTRKRTTRRWSASEPPPALQEISTSARSAVEPQAAKPKAKKKRSDLTVRHSAVAGSHGESSQKTTETEEAKQPTWDPQEPRQEGDVVEDEGGKGVERRRRQSEEEPTRKRTKRRRRAGEPPAALQEVSASARSAVEENAATPKAEKKRSGRRVRHSAVTGSHGEGSQRTTEMEEAKQPTWDPQEPRQEGDVVADEGGNGVERRRRQSEEEPTRKRTTRRRRAGEPPAALQEVSASARSAVESNAATAKAKKKRSGLTVRHSAVTGSHGEGSQRTTEMEEAKQPTWDPQEPRQEGDVVADEGGKGVERRRRQSEEEPTRKRTKRRRRAGEPPEALQEVSASARSAVEANAATVKAKKKRPDLTVAHSAVTGAAVKEQEELAGPPAKKTRKRGGEQGASGNFAAPAHLRPAKTSTSKGVESVREQGRHVSFELTQKQAESPGGGASVDTPEDNGKGGNIFGEGLSRVGDPHKTRKTSSKLPTPRHPSGLALDDKDSEKEASSRGGKAGEGVPIPSGEQKTHKKGKSATKTGSRSKEGSSSVSRKHQSLDRRGHVAADDGTPNCLHRMTNQPQTAADTTTKSLYTPDDATTKAPQKSDDAMEEAPHRSENATKTVVGLKPHSSSSLATTDEATRKRMQELEEGVRTLRPYTRAFADHFTYELTRAGSEGEQPEPEDVVKRVQRKMERLWRENNRYNLSKKYENWDHFWDRWLRDEETDEDEESGDFQENGVEGDVLWTPRQRHTSEKSHKAKKPRKRSPKVTSPTGTSQETRRSSRQGGSNGSGSEPTSNGRNNGVSADRQAEPVLRDESHEEVPVQTARSSPCKTEQNTQQRKGRVQPHAEASAGSGGERRTAVTKKGRTRGSMATRRVQDQQVLLKQPWRVNLARKQLEKLDRQQQRERGIVSYQARCLRRRKLRRKWLQRMLQQRKSLISGPAGASVEHQQGPRGGSGNNSQPATASETEAPQQSGSVTSTTSPLPPSGGEVGDPLHQHAGTMPLTPQQQQSVQGQSAQQQAPVAQPDYSELDKWVANLLEQVEQAHEQSSEAERSVQEVPRPAHENAPGWISSARAAQGMPVDTQQLGLKPPQSSMLQAGMDTSRPPGLPPRGQPWLPRPPLQSQGVALPYVGAQHRMRRSSQRLDNTMYGMPGPEPSAQVWRGPQEQQPLPVGQEKVHQEQGFAEQGLPQGPPQQRPQAALRTPVTDIQQQGNRLLFQHPYNIPTAASIPPQTLPGQDQARREPPYRGLLPTDQQHPPQQQATMFSGQAVGQSRAPPMGNTGPPNHPSHPLQHQPLGTTPRGPSAPPSVQHLVPYHLSSRQATLSDLGYSQQLVRPSQGQLLRRFMMRGYNVWPRMGRSSVAPQGASLAVGPSLLQPGMQGTTVKRSVLPASGFSPLHTQPSTFLNGSDEYVPNIVASQNEDYSSSFSSYTEHPLQPHQQFLRTPQSQQVAAPPPMLPAPGRDWQTLLQQQPQGPPQPPLQQAPSQFHSPLPPTASQANWGPDMLEDSWQPEEGGLEQVPQGWQKEVVHEQSSQQPLHSCMVEEQLARSSRGRSEAGSLQQVSTNSNFFQPPQIMPNTLAAPNYGGSTPFLSPGGAFAAPVQQPSHGVPQPLSSQQLGVKAGYQLQPHTPSAAVASTVMPFQTVVPAEYAAGNAGPQRPESEMTGGNGMPLASAAMQAPPRRLQQQEPSDAVAEEAGRQQRIDDELRKNRELEELEKEVIAGGTPLLRRLSPDLHTSPLAAINISSEEEAQLNRADEGLTETQMLLKSLSCFRTVEKHFTARREKYIVIVDNEAHTLGMREDEVLRLLFYGAWVACYFNVKQEQLQQLVDDQLNEEQELLLLRRMAETPARFSRRQHNLTEEVIRKFAREHPADNLKMKGTLGTFYSAFVVAGLFVCLLLLHRTYASRRHGRSNKVDQKMSHIPRQCDVELPHCPSRSACSAGVEDNSPVL